MTLRVLVVGATGKTGRRLVPELAARGVEIRAASRRGGDLPGAEPVRFAWQDASSYGPALERVGAVHLVMPPFVVDPGDFVETFLRTADAAGVHRIVLLTALGVDRADATAPMRRVELLVEQSGLPSTILRPAAFMENFSEPHWDGARRSIAESDEFVLPGGPTRVGYVSTGDIAAVAAHALTEEGHDGKGYSLTGPEALTMAEIAELIGKAVGRPIRHVETDLDGVRALLSAAGAPEDYVAYMTDLYRTALLSGGMATLTDDVELVTGRPPTSFAAFASAAAAHGVWRR